MGAGIFIKSYIDSKNRSQVELKVRIRGNNYSKALFKINVKDWDSKLTRVKNTSPLSVKLNKELSEMKELMYSSVELHQAGVYGFDELVRRLNGGSSSLDVESFAADVFTYLKPVSYHNILNALSTWRKTLGVDTLLLTDVNYSNNMEVFHILLY